MPKIHSLVVKNHLLPKRVIHLYILGHGYIQLAFNDQKRAKNGQKKAYQNEIVYFEAKYDFQVPKTLNLLIRTVCYLKE